MFNPFPELFFLQPLAPLIIRIVIGIFLIYLGYITAFKKRLEFQKKFRAEKYPFPNFIPWKLGIAEILVGSFLVIGLYTQITCIIAAYIFLNLAVLDNPKTGIIGYSRALYVIVTIVSLTLVLTGAGAFAFDLPF